MDPPVLPGRTKPDCPRRVDHGAPGDRFLVSPQTSRAGAAEAPHPAIPVATKALFFAVVLGRLPVLQVLGAGDVGRRWTPWTLGNRCPPRGGKGCTMSDQRPAWEEPGR